MEDKSILTTSQGTENVTDSDTKQERKADSTDKSKKQMGSAREIGRAHV